MIAIARISDEYNNLEEKIEWFISYLEHIMMTNNRSAEMYFRCTQIPRNTQWQDVNIINIVEAMDKSRETYEKFSQKYDETLIYECKELLQKVKTQICYINELQSSSSKSLQKYLADLAVCRKNHLDAWDTKETDVWFTEQALKFSLKMYLEKSEQWDMDLSKELQLIEKVFFEINEAFANCISSSQIFLKNQALILANIHNNTIIDQQKYKKDLFFDFPENETKLQLKIERTENKFVDEYDKMIDDLRSQNIDITKNIGIKMYGIFKIKKGYDTKLALVVITETRFLHAFDLENIVLESKMSDEHRNMFKKLQEKKKGPSFFSFKNEIVDKTEENALYDLKEAALDCLNVKNHSLKGFPFEIKNKLLRFDKNRKEITITEKKSTTLRSLFLSNYVKIKCFIDKDIFELFCVLCKKIPEIQEEAEKTKETEEPQVEEEPVESVSEQSDDDNPWRIQKNNE
ncbi:hypothetical protein M153_490000770 [Pseudoloma neurophilia]|uniref:Uncharacterized protein n=1 Tax=Pseudoloma neurophilia TaxID=146866 RepID=A0A0R0LX76_9MICR|nr:hypothetical protein M153_490000770 [Pseudoloma neurophilia]